jgi:hypothetical protein
MIEAAVNVCKKYAFIWLTTRCGIYYYFGMRENVRYYSSAAAFFLLPPIVVRFPLERSRRLQTAAAAGIESAAYEDLIIISITTRPPRCDCHW